MFNHNRNIVNALPIYPYMFGGIKNLDSSSIAVYSEDLMWNTLKYDNTFHYIGMDTFHTIRTPAENILPTFVPEERELDTGMVNLSDIADFLEDFDGYTVYMGECFDTHTVPEYTFSTDILAICERYESVAHRLIPVGNILHTFLQDLNRFIDTVENYRPLQ